MGREYKKESDAQEKERPGKRANQRIEVFRLVRQKIFKEISHSYTSSHGHIMAWMKLKVLFYFFSFSIDDDDVCEL